MPTIFKRLKHLKVTVDQNTKTLIGKEICQAYFDQPVKPVIFKVPSEEPEGQFMVLSYPRKFVPAMDEIIMKYAPKRKRLRISAYSTDKNKKV